MFPPPLFEVNSKGIVLGKNSVNQNLYNEVEKLGAKDMELCMQCGNCSAACPLSSGTNTFPRRIYRYLQLGLEDKLLEASEPWLCYYCGECNLDCPRGAEPAETMMAVRRWLTTKYDRTGLAKRFYLSKTWEIGALLTLALGIILLFVFGHGPIIVDHVSVNAFAPVIWVEIGDFIMAFVLSAFLMANAFRMFRYIMGNAKVSLKLYITEAKSFIIHFLTQKRWQTCAEDKTRWIKHFILVTGYLTMMSLIIIFLRWFQVDDNSWHFSSLFGYYATGTIMFVTGEMFYSRYKKKEESIHRYSHATDWLFLTLLFFTALTGIMMHFFRLADWAIPTYVIYVIHLAIAVPMLVIEVPFGKWSHLFYRPLAIFLTKVKEKSLKESQVDFETITKDAGDNFMSCIQCGACSSVCPWSRITYYSPRQILRDISLETCAQETVDTAVWDCATCGNCVEHCPRGIEIIDLVKSVREQNVTAGKLPEPYKASTQSLERNGNPWNGKRENRLDWANDINIPVFSPDNEYLFFACCATAYDPSPLKGCEKAGKALLKLLKHAGVSFGALGDKESCCGDQAASIGAGEIFSDLEIKNTVLFLKAGVKKVLTSSPHCMNAFRNHYDELKNSVDSEHYVELFDRLIARGRLNPALNVDLRATYHDPCYLGRHNGIYDAPRRILNRIPGLKLVEMDSNRERSLCCGGGGGGAWKDYPQGRRFGVLRVQEALHTNAEVIATACPYCILMLNDAIAELRVQDKIKVQDVTELLLKAVDISGLSLKD
jgi:Fe-S oxidoreductase